MYFELQYERKRVNNEERVCVDQPRMALQDKIGDMR